MGGCAAGFWVLGGGGGGGRWGLGSLLPLTPQNCVMIYLFVDLSVY